MIDCVPTLLLKPLCVSLLEKDLSPPPPNFSFSFFCCSVCVPSTTRYFGFSLYDLRAGKIAFRAFFSPTPLSPSAGRGDTPWVLLRAAGAHPFPPLRTTPQEGRVAVARFAGWQALGSSLLFTLMNKAAASPLV